MAHTNCESEYDRRKELAEFDDTKAGVKGLLEQGLKKIPRIFVDEQYMQEKKSNNFSKKSEFSIPVIDLGCLNEDASAARGRIIEQLKSACEEWGFFQIVNHGIPVSLLDNVLDVTRKFHELDADEKKPYYTRDFTKKVSYHSNFDLFQSKSANWRDSLDLIMAPDPPHPQELPPVCREAILEYGEEIKKLGKVVFELMSEGLGLKPNHLSDMDCAEGLLLSAQYYPICPEPDLTLGASSHTDIGFLSLLLQDQTGGLQVRYQDQWVDVSPIPGAILINIADHMQLITNGKFKSVYHRVLTNNERSRVSFGFFFRMHMKQSISSKIYGPIKELLSEENPAIYRDAMGGEIVMHRYTKGFNDGKPILSHFELNATKDAF